MDLAGVLCGVLLGAAQDAELVVGEPVTVDLEAGGETGEASAELLLAAGLPGSDVILWAVAPGCAVRLRVETEDGTPLGSAAAPRAGAPARLELRRVDEVDLWVTVSAAPGSTGPVEVQAHRFAELPAPVQQELDGILRGLLPSASLGRELAAQRQTAADRLLALLQEHEHPRLADALSEVGMASLRALDWETAERAERALVEFLTRVLPEGDARLARARQNLSMALSQNGKLKEAYAQALAGLQGLLRTLDEKEPDVLKATSNLAEVCRQRGDLGRARELLEPAIAATRQRLGENNPEVLLARSTMAVLLTESGDLWRALEELESVHAALASGLVSDNPSLLLSVRRNLAILRQKLGDVQGALDLKRELYEETRRMLPDGHPLLIQMRGTFAAGLLAAGERERALELLETNAAELEQTRPPEDLELWKARLNTSATRFLLGDTEGALQQDEKVHEALSRLLREGDGDLLVARRNLAESRFAAGDVEAANELLDSTCGAYARWFPPYFPDALGATLLRARIQVSQGAVEVARDLLQGAVQAAESRVDVLAGALGLRGQEAAQQLEAELLEALLALPPAQDDPAQDAADVLGAVVAFRGLVDRQVRLLHGLEERAAGDAHLEELLGEARSARRRWLDATQAASSSSFAELAELRRAMEEAERELLRAGETGTEEAPGVSADVARLRHRLGSGEAAVVAAVHDVRSSEAHPVLQARVLTLFVVPPGTAPLQRLDLVGREDLPALCAAFRARLESTVGLRRGATVIAPERRPSPGGDDLGALLRPLWEALPADTRRLYVSPDQELASVPWAAIPLPDGVLAGDRYEIVYVDNLTSLEPRAPLQRSPSLLVMGGMDYGVPSAAVAGSLGVARPGLRDRGDSWQALPGTLREVQQVQSLFHERLSEAETELRTGSAATRHAFLELAPRFRMVHVATHAFAAPAATGPMIRPGSLETGESGFYPGLLCGLVFAGANRAEPGSDGSGIVTGAELSTLDLGECELVVLSACETNVGERSFGNAVTGLNRALHLAGARRTITSLWKVDDEGAEVFFQSFYSALFSASSAVAEALRVARHATEEAGFGPGVWAAFVLYESG